MAHPNAFTVRQALKTALRYAHIATETGNRELYSNCREFIYSNFRNRNNPKVIVLNR